MAIRWQMHQLEVRGGPQQGPTLVNSLCHRHLQYKQAVATQQSPE